MLSKRDSCWWEAKLLKVFASVIIAVGISASAHAGCVGTDTFKTCTDESGNTYSVSKFGNTTSVQGYNSRTGSSWSQESNKFGNTTITNGRDADGNSWNMQQQKLGSGSFTTGTDSDGNPFSYYSTNPRDPNR